MSNSLDSLINRIRRYQYPTGKEQLALYTVGLERVLTMKLPPSKPQDCGDYVQKQFMESAIDWLLEKQDDKDEYKPLSARLEELRKTGYTDKDIDNLKNYLEMFSLWIQNPQNVSDIENHQPVIVGWFKKQLEKHSCTDNYYLKSILASRKQNPIEANKTPITPIKNLSNESIQAPIVTGKQIGRANV